MLCKIDKLSKQKEVNCKIVSDDLYPLLGAMAIKNGPGQGEQRGVPGGGLESHRKKKSNNTKTGSSSPEIQGCV